MTNMLGSARIDSSYKLEHAATRPQGRIFATGTQALVRMLLMQRLVDRRDGVRSAGFVSGYRGSPLAGVDTELWRAKAELASHEVRFLPGINEDLAATAVAGTQRVGIDPARKVDGVFAMWYGKGPGVDRAGDAIRHGHAAGTSDKGGVLLIVGDDHAATSSSIPNASDLSLIGWGVPIVHPASVDEYVTFGLWGWAASRYSGAWIAFKAISETVESSRSFTAGALPSYVVPTDYQLPPGRLGYSTTEFLTQAIELRMAKRLEALSAFARSNSIDRLEIAAPGADLGIITVGKSHFDVMEALARVAHTSNVLEMQGVRIWRPGLTFPIDRRAFETFARGLKHILVVEEKAALVETQVKDYLFNRPACERPSVVGKSNLDGTPLISPLGQHRPSLLAAPLSAWLAIVRPELSFHDKLAQFDKPTPLANISDGAKRLPYFCSGCPHSSSTKVPDGSVALAGVGCHYMASWMDRSTSGLTQMGGEGVDWVGQAAFTDTPHVFQNMGEGTYFHSGHLAIRQAIASGANVTYKILFNDAVAMTGGQPVDGAISVPQIARQMKSEGAVRVAIVTDEPHRYRQGDLDSDVEVHDRRDLDLVQRDLRTIKGVTILIYDQTCGAEKRRRRKRGKYPDPARRMFINAAVCEGCGDCGKTSNCLSIVPVETELGRKRAIDQASCNKDFSCVEGFCPSFVSVVGGSLRKTGSKTLRDHGREVVALPDPQIHTVADRPHNLLIAGVGGTGIITVGAVVAMAAHLDGREVAELDFTALAQKGGSVICHLRTAPPGIPINQVRIDWQQADAVIISDAIVGCLPDCLGTMRAGATRVLLDTHLGATAEFTRNPDADPHRDALADKICHAAGKDSVVAFDAHSKAREALGDTTGTNMYLVGHAWQQGLIPVSHDAFMRAIELNGVAVEANKNAFNVGRADAVPQSRRKPSEVVPLRTAKSSLEALVEHRSSLLAEYQDQTYADTYRSFIALCQAEELRPVSMPGDLPFAHAVARNLYKLMSFKDEYEVARLYTRREFLESLEREFEGDYRLQFHLAPPLLARPRKGQSTPQKLTFGPWMLAAFRLLTRLKVLRGGPFDLFGYMAERRMERQLIVDYRAMIEEILPNLSDRTHATAIELAELPAKIRGFGHIKESSVREAKRREAVLRERLHAIHAPASPTASVAV